MNIESLGFNKRTDVKNPDKQVFVKRLHDLIWAEFEDGFLTLIRKSEIRNETHSIVIPKKFNTFEELNLFCKAIE